MDVLKKVYPQNVWKHFTALCSMAHGSGNEKAVSDYCMEFAKAHGLEAWQDEVYNVVIRKPASRGYENHEAVMLQGHLDMVAVKTAECKKDLSREGLDLRLDGDTLYAEGTSLGGDDGIAVAIALAILEDDSIAHPPLEAVFTVGEEVGMVGAKALDCSKLKSKYLLNLDNEGEGKLLIGCAGGIISNCTFAPDREDSGRSAKEIEISGLRGGHSGWAIRFGRANACKLMGEILESLLPQDIGIAEINGGEMDNIIARSCRALVTVPQGTDLSGQIAAWREKLRARFPDEADLTLTLRDAGTAEKQFTAKSRAALLRFMVQVPDGVQAWENEEKKIPETSLNFGVLRTEGGKVLCDIMLRSHINAEKKALAEKVEALCRDCGGEVSYSGEYAAWEYRGPSKLTELAEQVFSEQYGSEPKMLTTHGGVECGILREKMPDLDVISYGPDINKIHTVNENMSVASAGRVYDYTLKLLKRL